VSEDGAPRGDQRFGREERLRKRREFLAVQGGGRKIHLPHLLVIIRPNQGRRRIGITVSAKVGGAVERNRIKRLLREVWRRDRELLPQALDFVFIAKKNATAATFEGLRAQLADLARRLRRQGRS
jgi:ribonuclease P protein component